MVSRKEVYGILFSPLVALGGLGCAELPLQPPKETSQQQAQVGQARHPGSDSQTAAGLRIPVTPITQPAPGSSDSSAIVQAGASGSSAPGPVPSAASSSISNDPTTKLHTLYREAAARYANVDSYIVRLIRREQLNGKDKREEILLFKFRKEPWSVYFKWLGTESKGREVVYVRGRYENKIHTLLAAGDVPLMPAGKRFAMAPDSPLVLSSSRHSIHEAGIGVLIENFGKCLDDANKGGQGHGTAKYLGPMQRPEFAGPCEAVEQTIVPGAEPQLPRGGRRLWGFDPETKFPVLIITQDDTGHEVEYYCYDRFEFPVHLDDDDFNPDKLWKPQRDGTPQK
jgi:hypothetical protein